MTVNHSSTLSVEYFQSYIQLVMNSREISLEEAEGLINQIFFKGNLHLYGVNTRSNYEIALKNLKYK